MITELLENKKAPVHKLRTFRGSIDSSGINQVDLLQINLIYPQNTSDYPQSYPQKNCQFEQKVNLS